MSEVKVTRAHREAVATAFREAYGCTLSDGTIRWIEDGAQIDEEYRVFQREALLIATAEHNLRAAVIADLRGLAERAAPAFPGGCDVVFADSIELLLETLEAQQ